MKESKSFSKKLSRGVLYVTASLFVAVIMVAAISSHLIIADEAKNSTEHLVNATVKDIEKTLQRVEFSVEASSWLVNENRNKDEYLYHITRMIVTENDNIVGSAIAFADGVSKKRHFFSPYSYVDPASGKVVSKQLGNENYDYFTMEWFNSPYTEGEACWTEPYFDEGGGGYMMSTYSFPIRDGQGNIYAVITADVTLDWIDRLIEAIKPYKESFSIMLSRKGTCLGYSGKKGSQGIPLDSLFEGRMNNYKAIDGASDTGKGIARYMSGSKMFFAVYDTLKNGWILAVSCEYKDVLARATKMHMVLILIGILGILALYFICRHAISKMTRPLLDFCSAAKNIAEGDFDAQLPEIKTEDELGQLHDAFANMQDSLKTYTENLKDTTARNERLQSELNIASRIQQAMLSKDFPTEGVDMSATLKSAKEVGGDLYDFFVKDGSLYFAIADVSGKGVPASMFMAITKSAFRFIAGMGLPLSEVMAKMNNAVCSGNSYNMFVTMFIGKIDLKTRMMEYCNAGHNPVVVDGKFLPVVPNIVLGAIPGFDFKQQSTTLDEGSRLILYTDGITEAENAAKQQFGNERLLLWAASKEGNSEQACGSLMSCVHDFVAGNEQNDDMTLMIIDIK